MARTITVQQLMDRVRQRTDQVESRFIQDPELISYIDAAYTTLYDLLVLRFKHYKLDFATFSTSSGVNLYQLPVNFYKMVGLDNAQGWSASSFNFEERAALTNAAYISDSSGFNLRYCIVGDSLLLLPSPEGSETLTLWYVPVPARLDNAADVVDGIAGYEEVVICLACVFVSIKSERDPAPFERLLKFHMERIEEASTQRDAGEPGTVIDARGLYVNLHNTFSTRMG